METMTTEYRIRSREDSREPLLVVAVMLIGSLMVSGVLTQEPGAPAPADAQAKPAAPAKKIPLYDREPFDLVTLDEENKNAQLEVFPIEVPGGRRPFAPSADTRLTIRLLDNEDEEYEILGRSIRKVELFEELLVNEGNRLVGSAMDNSNGMAKSPEEKERLFDEAFHHFYRVRQIDPGWPNLRESIDRYVFFDAANLNAMQRYGEAITIIEELYDRNPEFKLTAGSPTLSDVMGRLLNSILTGYFEKRDFLGMRTLLKRMSDKYGDKKPQSVDVWIEKLSGLANEHLEKGRQHLAAQRYRDAISSVKEMGEIWPDVPGGSAFAAEVSQAYPIVFVGVTQPAVEHDSRRLDDWAARRTGRLVYRLLVEFLQAGSAGGEYQLSMGSMESSDDRLKLTLRIASTTGDEASPITGYEVANRLLQIATPGSPDYSVAWAALVNVVSVKSVNTVEIELRRPHVLPEALLRVPLTPRTGDSSTGAGDGPFRVQSRTESEVQFAHKTFAPGARLAEVVEITYENSQKAYGGLRRGEIDIVDRLFPADALRMRAEASFDTPIRIEPYALPTVHMLVPNLQNPFLANREFRRGVLTAINRTNILQQELMGGRTFDGFQVISGPFPARSGEADPLGYAYDESTAPRPFNPLLAKALTLVSTKQVAEVARKRGEPEPKLAPFVLGYPSNEIARVACQAIAAQLQVIGLETQLREFPPGVSHDLKGDCDLIYKEIAIWEPVTDAARILRADGVAPTPSPYVLQSIRWLEEAENWGDARARLVDIHRAVHNDIAVLPLWQTVNFYACHNRVDNVGENLVWLYEHIDNWRLKSSTGVP